VGKTGDGVLNRLFNKRIHLNEAILPAVRGNMVDIQTPLDQFISIKPTAHDELNGIRILNNTYKHLSGIYLRDGRQLYYVITEPISK
jgi:hypothetical protein